MLPVCCFTCGKVFRLQREILYQRPEDERMTFLKEMGYTRECCTRNILQTIDTHHLRDLYDTANAVKPPDFVVRGRTAVTFAERVPASNMGHPML
jgi:DNA-directed RNA polymerase subunit N (RpoN/RPB10)